MKNTPKQTLDRLENNLKELVGLHRKLMEIVRMEYDALSNADLKEVREVTYHKEAILSEIFNKEKERQSWVGQLSVVMQKKPADLRLSQIPLLIQDKLPQEAESFRSIYNTLTVLIDHIVQQNKRNQRFIQTSLGHVTQMKNNVLGATKQKSESYSSKGKKVSTSDEGRLLSKEI